MQLKIKSRKQDTMLGQREMFKVGVWKP